MNKLERDLLQKDKLIDFFNPLQSHISCSEKFSELPESLEPRSAGKCAFLEPCLTVIALPFRGWWRKNPENSNQESWSDPWKVKHPVGSLTCAFILPPSRSSCAPLAKILLGTRWWKPANNSAYSVFKTLKCPAKGGSWHPSKFTNKKCYCGFYIFMLGLIFVSSWFHSCSQLRSYNVIHPHKRSRVRAEQDIPLHLVIYFSVALNL